MKEVFAHYRLETGAKRPVHVTACTLIGEGEDSAVGISICSWKDQYDRKLGNKIARGRAEKALRLRRNIGPVREVLQVLILFPFKGRYRDPEATGAYLENLREEPRMVGEQS